MRLTPWILERVVPNYSDTENIGVRARIGLFEGWSSVVLNTVLFFVKGALGLLTGSVALVADAVHTLADSLTSVVVILGFRMAEKPPDDEHPFGHGRMENVAAVVIAVLLAVIAFEMLKAAGQRLLHPKLVQAPAWVIAILIGTIVLKELLARFSFDLGGMIKSETLTADGWHHRSDVLATGLVIIAFIGAHWNLTRLDGAMGIGVAIMIGWAAFAILYSAMNPLLGQRAPEVMYEEIARIAHLTPGVQGVHDILVNQYGFLNIVSLHIEVSASENAMRLHEMGDEIETKIRQRYGGHAIVHVDPLNTDHGDYEEVRRIVSEIITEQDGLASFHDLRLMGYKKRLKVVFDVAPRRGAAEFSMRELRNKVKERLSERFPHARVVIDLEPLYFHNVAESQESHVGNDPGSKA